MYDFLSNDVFVFVLEADKELSMQLMYFLENNYYSIRWNSGDRPTKIKDEKFVSGQVLFVKLSRNNNLTYGYTRSELENVKDRANVVLEKPMVRMLCGGNTRIIDSEQFRIGGKA